jgi:hypothetical protein
VRFFDPAGPVGAVRVRAGLLGAPLADLAFPVDGGFPGGLGDLADRGLLAGTQRPADGPGDLVPVPGREPVQLLHQVMAGAGSVAGDHDLAPESGRQRGDGLAEQPQVISGRVAAG